MRVLFVLKQRDDYGNYNYGGGFSSGLLNSAKFAADMLADNGFDTKVVEVVDNNSIDYEVTLFRPDVVIIEALWVVPEKFDILRKLHPKVRWIVRIHSESAFLAQEAIAINWISRYPAKGVEVALNSKEALDELIPMFVAKALDLSKLLYLPTFYPAPEGRVSHKRFKGEYINVANPGAIRPLKNNLMQAQAAIRFAQSRELYLVYHINSGRVESGGNPVYQNLLALFEGTPHRLVQHNWMGHDHFLNFLKTIDICLQVSFSETFSIISADAVATGTPIVGSEAIPWLIPVSQPDTLTIKDIVKGMDRVLNNTRISHANLMSLRAVSEEAEEEWLEVLG